MIHGQIQSPPFSIPHVSREFQKEVDGLMIKTYLFRLTRDKNNCQITPIKMGMDEQANQRLFVRVHQQWPGQNTFFCDGRCISGPKSDQVPRAILVLVVLGVSAVFFAEEASTLWAISPALVAVPLVFEIMFFVSLFR